MMMLCMESLDLLLAAFFPQYDANAMQLMFMA